MTTSILKNDRRRKIERRKHNLTIHFPDRRSGQDRRIWTHGRPLPDQKDSDHRGETIFQHTGFGCEIEHQIAHAVKRQIGDLGGDD